MWLLLFYSAILLNVGSPRCTKNTTQWIDGSSTSLYVTSTAFNRSSSGQKHWQVLRTAFVTTLRATERLGLLLTALELCAYEGDVKAQYRTFEIWNTKMDVGQLRAELRYRETLKLKITFISTFQSNWKYIKLIRARCAPPRLPKNI